MLVSVITVSYNSASTIKNTLQSVALQTYPLIEHIIIDNNSTDDTLSIAKQFPHLQKIISEPDKGIYDAMNKGIKIASGEIISILNSDDVFENDNVVEDVINIFNSSDASIVYGNLSYVSKINNQKIIRSWKSSAYKPNAFLYGWHPPHPTLFIKKKVYNQYGMFDTTLPISADFELMLRFIEKYKVKTIHLNKLLVRMQIGGASNTSIKNIFTGNVNIKKAFKKNNISYKIYYPVLRLLPKLLQFIKK